jgi:hypothetical protein
MTKETELSMVAPRKPQGIFRWSIKRGIFFMMMVVTLSPLLSIGKYSMISISPGVIKQIEFYSDKDLQEIKMTGQLRRHDKTEIPTHPKLFVAKIKKNYHVVYIDSKKYYVNVFVSYWYGSMLYLAISFFIFAVALLLFIKLCKQEALNYSCHLP